MILKHNPAFLLGIRFIYTIKSLPKMQQKSHFSLPHLSTLSLRLLYFPHSRNNTTHTYFLRTAAESFESKKKAEQKYSLKH